MEVCMKQGGLFAVVLLKKKGRCTYNPCFGVKAGFAC